MSYEGYVETICEEGHYRIVSDNGYNSARWRKPCWCSSRKFHMSNIDVTNGTNPNHPWSLPAKKIETGFHDIPRVDHRGNQYVKMAKTYLPDMSDQEVGPCGTNPRWQTMTVFVPSFIEVNK